MPRVGSAYAIAADSHDQLTSTGTADVASATMVDGTTAFYIQAITVDCYLTVDGTTPSSTNGLRIYAGQMPFFVPLGDAGNATVKVASVSGSTSTVNIAWLR